jgi:ATP synthase protein I
MKIQGVSPRQQAYRLVALQMVVTGVLAIGWLCSSWIAAVSALLGGLAAVLPSFYFANRFFATTHARQGGKIIRAFYWGELTKLLSSAFLVVFISRLWPEMAMLPFVSGFAAASMSVWLAPLAMRR